MKGGEGINQRTFMHKEWMWTTLWVPAWGGERGGLGGGERGRESENNCNSINNKNKI